MKNKTYLLLIILIVIVAGVFGSLKQKTEKIEPPEELLAMILVQKMAEAWKTGDEELLDEILHEDAIFAYPGRRLNKEETLEDLRYFAENFIDTEVYIHNVIVDDEMVAVEWQFASTLKETGNRQVVSDAIIGEIKDGQIIVWKEYLDGRVKTLQAEGQLYLEEGEEPFPWPNKTELYQRH